MAISGCLAIRCGELILRDIRAAVTFGSSPRTPAECLTKHFLMLAGLYARVGNCIFGHIRENSIPYATRERQLVGFGDVLANTQRSPKLAESDTGKIDR